MGKTKDRVIDEVVGLFVDLGMEARSLDGTGAFVYTGPCSDEAVAITYESVEQDPRAGRLYVVGKLCEIKNIERVK